MDIFKLLAIVSPFISAGLAALFTHYFTLKGKRFDILYEAKIPAFKEISTALMEFRKYLIGRLAYINASEYSPFYNEGVGGLEHRTVIATAHNNNFIFLSTSSQKEIEDLINNISWITSTEASISAGEEQDDILSSAYENLIQKTDNCLKVLFDELNLTF